MALRSAAGASVPQASMASLNADEGRLDEIAAFCERLEQPPGLAGRRDYHQALAKLA